MQKSVFKQESSEFSISSPREPLVKYLLFFAISDLVMIGVFFFCLFLAIGLPYILPSPESSEVVVITVGSPHYDEQLWFTQEGCDEKHFLPGNPHTFHGRMAAWCPKHQQGFCVSKSEMQECSMATRYWMAGFLSGNEPEYPTDDEGYSLGSDDPRVKKWRAAIQLFAQTGVWVQQERACQRCGDELLPSFPGLICEKCLATSSGSVDK